MTGRIVGNGVWTGTPEVEDFSADDRRCHYVKDDGRQCRGSAAGDTDDVSLCVKHLLAAYRLLVSEPALESLLFTPRAWPNAALAEFDRRWDENNKRTVRRSTAPSVVYYLRFGDRIKIGTTINLTARLAEVPHDELLATEPGGFAEEKARHREFAHARVYREWFDGSDVRLLDHIATLGTADASVA